MNDRVFAQLKPVELDGLTEDAYLRRRSDDLARAFQTPRSPQRSRRLTMPRLPFLITAATAAAGIAAAVIVVPGLVSGDPAPGAPTAAVVSRGSQDSQEPQTVDARSFLLAAAVTAAREPAGSGRYWYTRERVIQQVTVDEAKYTARVKTLVREWEARKKELKGKPAELEAADKEMEKKVGELKASPPKVSYAATAAYTEDSWHAREKGDSNRTVGNQDVKITFGSPEDREKWKEEGSPVLREDKPSTSDLDLPLVLSIDNPTLTLQSLAGLPTDKEGLERRLRSLYGKSSARDRVDFAGYLPQTSLDLLRAPLTPGTRSALFKVLAEQPGITSQGEVTDALGRTGVALTSRFTSDGDSFEFRLIFDEKSAKLLEYSTTKEGESSPLTRVAYQDTGWVDRLGERPQD
ncbi:CU044_5270 family protein [Streptosporangium sp. 'caverna']|uniref:CU044_5270 family protein n=1 Tax=Streptosporangium sp. 'caverna' TaxID=2202249 RepID=UPI0013A6902C|nr:CU044_5270 family protein [Streptosporangium sp. 'caverna']